MFSLTQKIIYVIIFVEMYIIGPVINRVFYIFHNILDSFQSTLLVILYTPSTLLSNLNSFTGEFLALKRNIIKSKMNVAKYSSFIK